MRFVVAFLVLSGLAALAAVIYGNVPLDYGYYLDQWRLVLAGDNPWRGNNAYGPLHNAFAPLITLDPLLPKVAVAGLLLAANAALVLRLLRIRHDDAWIETYAIALAANPLFTISAFWLGLNDALVAALVIAAVLARHSDRLVLAGVLLGLATLDKYYPALLIPFFALDARRFAPRLVVSALVTIAAGLAIATLVWDSQWMEALAFGVSRDATILSIFHPIAVFGRDHGLSDLADALVRFNGPLVVIVWLAAIAVAWLRRERWLVSATWGLFAVLLAYKVGNQQFFVTWLGLVACLPLLTDPSAERLARVSLPYAIFLGLFELGYVFLQPQYYQGQWHWIIDWIGVPSFALGVILLVQYFRSHAAATGDTARQNET
ncbi:MAG: glycosyltransferase 87 family protein [Devosia sp.]